MEIVNINNERIGACFRFNIGKFEISASTIMNKNKAEIAVFNGDEMIEGNIRSIQDAILLVNNLIVSGK